MKKAYVKPAMTSEEFIPSQYVAACSLIHNIIKGDLYCAIPGTDVYHINDGGKENNNPYGDHASSANRTHGGTGCGGTVDIYGDTGIESNGSKIFGLDIWTSIGVPSANTSFKKENYKNTITDNWGSVESNKWYYVTFSSKDNGGYQYDHYGALKVTGTSAKNAS